MIEVRVAEIIDETPHIKSIRFVRADGQPLGIYQAGAHVDVVGPTMITRQYSLASKPEDPDSYVVAVKREENSRGGSVALHELKVGDVLKISEPRNLLSIDPDAEHHVFLAAGIGITPMLSMARYLDLHGRDFDLHYFARSREDAAFIGLLEEKCPQKLHSHLGVPISENRTIVAEALRDLPPNTHLYMCGPTPFMDLVTEIASEVLPAEKIHQENFSAAEQPDASENQPFEVEFEGEVYQVPADRTLVSVLQEEAGAEIDTSCEEGICGTCIMAVLDGEPDHRDNVLTEAERQAGDQLTTCVSRAKSARLTVDYF